MEELQLTAPAAHEHLVSLAQEQQERLAATVLRLTHVELVKSSNNEFWGESYSAVPVEQHTAEQRQHDNRVNGMMVEAARLLGTTGSQLEADVENQEVASYEPVDQLLCKRAKQISLDEATEAARHGDHNLARSNIENLLVIRLLEPAHYQDDKEIRELVGRGLADDLLTVVDRMKGIVAFNEEGSGLRDSADQLKGTANLIRLATNKDFDERFDYVSPLVRPGALKDAAKKREILLQTLAASELTALARVASEHKHNPQQASYLARKALDKLTDPHASWYSVDSDEAALTVILATEYTAQTSDDKRMAEVNNGLAKLRELRSAGLKPYRTNSQATDILDETVVRLLVSQKQEIARSLISSSSHEVSPIGAAPSEAWNYNLDNAVESARYLSTNNKSEVLASLRKMHTEKVQELRQRLQVNGAPPPTVESILEKSVDPDSALDITPEFWARYAQIINEQSSSDHHKSHSAWKIRELIEGDHTYRLAEKSVAITRLLDAGLSPEQLSYGLLINLDKLQDQADKDEYLRQMGTAANTLKEYYRDKPYEDIGFILGAISRFKQPQGALNLVQDLYDGNPDMVRGLAYVLDDHDFSEGLCEVAPAAEKNLRYIAEYAPNADIMLADTQFMRNYLVEAHYDDLVSLVDCMQSSPDIILLSHYVAPLHMEKYLLNGDSVTTQAANIVKAYEDVGFGELLKTLDASSDIQQQLTESLIVGTDVVETASSIVQTFAQTGIGEMLKAYPEQAAFIITMLRQYNFQTAQASALVAAINKDGISELFEYVGASAADTLLRTIIGNNDPELRANQILHLYESLDFLQEANIILDYAGHADEWMAFVDKIPDGENGHRLKQQIVARLQLNIGEDATQAIRIFSDIAANPELAAEINNRNITLIQKLYKAESVRGFPSAKPTKLSEICIDPELREIYQELYRLKQNGDGDAMTALMRKHGWEFENPEVNLSELIAGIRADVDDISREERAAARWLKDFSGQPIKAAKLVEAWKSRALALSYGVKDNPTDILSFVTEKGVQIYADRAMASGATDITPEEFAAQNYIMSAIGSRYSPQVTFKALEQRIHYIRENGPYAQKIFKPGSGELMAGDRSYKAEVFDSDDPRGFTIGFDTGCCMTLGGASESCIWAGYEDPRYSFFAVYDDAGRLRAQSILYIVGNDDRRVLVVDNIEANNGTDLTTITDIYREALTTFAKEQGLKLNSINVGVGYTPAEIIKRLPQANYRPATPRANTYTDASDQRILWSE